MGFKDLFMFRVSEFDSDLHAASSSTTPSSKMTRRTSFESSTSKGNNSSQLNSPENILQYLNLIPGGDDISSIHHDGSVSQNSRFVNSRSELDQILSNSEKDRNRTKNYAAGEERNPSPCASVQTPSLGGFEVYTHGGDSMSILASNISLFSIPLLKHPTQKDFKTNKSFETILVQSLKCHMRLMNTWAAELSSSESDQVNEDFSQSQVGRLLFQSMTKVQDDDPKAIEETAKAFIRKSNFERAFKVYIRLLQTMTWKSSSRTTRADMLTEVSILALLRGDIGSSTKFGKQALNLNREQSQQSQTSINLIVLGLGNFALKKFDDALKQWREALQLSCMVYGYEHPFNATLLNNIGCLHYHEEDLPTSLKTLTESHDLNREVLCSSSLGSNSFLLSFATSKANIATIGARSGDFDWATNVLEEVLSLQSSVIEEGGAGDFFIQTTIYTIERLGREVNNSSSSNAEASNRKFKRPSLAGYTPSISVASRASITSLATQYGVNTRASFASRATQDGANTSSDFAAIQSCSTFHQPVQLEEVSPQPCIFGGDIDGIPMRRGLTGTKSTIVDATDESDVLNFLMFGPIHPVQYTPAQRVRSSVLNWFGKTLDDDNSKKLMCVPFGGTPRIRASIPVDLDEDAVIDAELHLKGIIEQATDYLEHDEVDEARELFQSVRVSHIEKYGKIHHLAGTANHNIGLCHMYAQEYVQAKAYFEDAVKIRESALGKDHPAVAASLLFIGMIYMVKGNPQSSIETFSKVLKLVRKSKGRGTIQAAQALNNIAVAQYHQAKYQDAFRTMFKANSTLRKVLRTSQNSKSDNVGTPLFKQTKTTEIALSYTLRNLAFLYHRQGDYSDALLAYEEACKIQQKHVDFRFSDVGSVEINLQHVHAMIGDVSRKEKVEEEEYNKLNDCTTLDKAIEEFKKFLRC